MQHIQQTQKAPKINNTENEAVLIAIADATQDTTHDPVQIKTH